MDDSDVRLAGYWWGRYRALGLNPLPSRTDDKRPLVKFRDYWTELAPANLFDRHPTANLQIVLGAKWRLLVVDIDGPQATDQFRQWAVRDTTPTWESFTDSGIHVWYKCGPGLKIVKRTIWDGDGAHSAIEVLCNRSLAVAPPSIHPTRGVRYRWRMGHGPDEMPFPTEAPGWLLRRCVEMASARTIVNRGSHLEALDGFHGDRVAYAASLGLQITGPPGETGWVPCRAFDREDRRPSAAIHRESGYYVDKGSDTKLRFTELIGRLKPA
jgi:hypothetical protein